MIVNVKTFSETEYEEVQRRVALASDDIREFLDAKLEEIVGHPGVEHPFLNQYALRGLDAKRERQLYLETYYYFRHVAFYICTICTLTRDENILREVIRNVADEMGSSKSHATLYLEFLEKIGITARDIEAYVPLASTLGLNVGIRALYMEPTSSVKAMGALYAEECQSASMVYKYNEGLKQSHHDKKVRAFWELHVRAEVGHSNSVFNCIHPYLSDVKNRALFSEGIAEYMLLLQRYWDGIQRLVGLP